MKKSMKKYEIVSASNWAECDAYSVSHACQQHEEAFGNEGAEEIIAVFLQSAAPRSHLYAVIERNGTGNPPRVFGPYPAERIATCAAQILKRENGGVYEVAPLATKSHP